MEKLGQHQLWRISKISGKSSLLPREMCPAEERAGTEQGRDKVGVGRESDGETAEDGLPAVQCGKLPCPASATFLCVLLKVEGSHTT